MRTTMAEKLNEVWKERRSIGYKFNAAKYQLIILIGWGVATQTNSYKVL